MTPRPRTDDQGIAGDFLQHAKAPGADDVAAVLDKLRSSLSLVRAESRSDVTLLDTVDWRLLRADLVLEHERCGGAATLVLRGVGQGPERLATADATPPGSAATVTGSFLRDTLASASSGRALLALARVRRQESFIGLRDEDGKLRLALALRTERVVGRRARPVRYLQIRPVTGYISDARRARRALVAAGWEASEDPVHQLLHSAGREPLDYPLPSYLPLDPEMPALAAFNATALRLLQTMEINLPGLRGDLDTEFLHDFRVGLRRTRALIGELSSMLPVSVATRFKREFRWLGALSGPARDGDVQTAEMAAIAARLDAGDRAAMAPFQYWLATEREKARAELLKALDSARYRRLVRAWRERLQRPVPAHSKLPDATRPVAEVAENRIRKAYRRVLRKGGRIDSSSPPEHLHELRKDAKKLRYLIESFRLLYDQSAVDVLVSDLKALQDNLGEYQDVEVQRQLMQGYAPQAPAATAALLIRLAERLAVREAGVRAEFSGRFKAFSARPVRKHLERMLARTHGSDAA